MRLSYSELAINSTRSNRRPGNRVEQEWIEASFCMKSGADDTSTNEQVSWTFRGPCPGTPVIRVSFYRVGRELQAKILLQPSVSDAFRVALRFNPISFLSHHNPKLRELLEPFTLVTSVDFRVRCQNRPVCSTAAARRSC
jgi:hypothetical protein